MLRTIAGWRRAGSYRGFLPFVAGLLCLQAAWMLTVPAFRGIDEIDHAYRAASVVRGDIGPATRPVPDGRGLMVMVPAGMVEAARPACAQLKYVDRGNCVPVTDVQHNGTVPIASAAGAYMPLYYAVVGWPSLFLDGERALYGMRIASMLLCDVFLLLAAAIALGRRSSWHQAGLVLCLTPTVVYATIIAAPNAVAMSGGLLMWVAWTTADPSLSRRDNQRYAWFGVAGAVATSLTHNTGPIWVLVTIVVMAWIWRPRLMRSQDLRLLWPGAGVILGAFAAALLWTRYSSANSLHHESVHPRSDTPQISDLAMLPVRWLFQSVFGAPRPGGMTTGLVYGLAFTLILLLVMAGFQRAESRVKHAMVVIAFTLTALPFLLTLLTYDTLGFAWQGRYSIPLGAGITLLAAAALNRTTAFRPVHLLAMAALGVVQVGAVLSARANVAAEGAQFLAPAWVAPVLCLVGLCLWLGCLRRVGLESDRSAVDSTEASGPVTTSA